jgi:hypothetical protein
VQDVQPLMIGSRARIDYQTTSEIAGSVENKQRKENDSQVLHSSHKNCG